MLDKLTPALIVLLCTIANTASATPSLCDASEQVLFNCSTSNKIISVCAPQDLAPDHGYLQYRFGRPGQVEMLVPSDKSITPAASAVAGSMMFSGGGGDYLRFHAEDYNYVVYTAIGTGWGEKDGVAISENGKRITHVACVDEPQSKLGTALDEKAGLKMDTGAFDLP